MGIFTRFRDIISSNINAMLDKAEDPEKLIKLMIREMEDTLVELKASCAAVIAGCKKIQRRLEETNTRASHWESRARLAVEKGRDDLAREALVEKRRFSQMAGSLTKEQADHEVLIDQYQNDIRQLEEKLTRARDKKRILIQRQIRAKKAKQAQEEIRRMDNFDTMAKFDDLEQRIDRMEADADLVNYGKQPGLDEQIGKLVSDDEIEKELTALKTIRPSDKQESSDG
ncbi:MAG: phage shock protein PspA [Desulfobacteraceae bacterium]|nr:phage shock protein PspA [Desulfobacteraceae bacterium]